IGQFLGGGGTDGLVSSLTGALGGEAGQGLLGDVLGGAGGSVLGALGLGPDSTTSDMAQSLFQHLGVDPGTADTLGDVAGVAGSALGVTEAIDAAGAIGNEIGINVPQ